MEIGLNSPAAEHEGRRALGSRPQPDPGPSSPGLCWDTRVSHYSRRVSEDRRVARADGEPTKHGPAGAARWSAYLDWMRQEIIDGVLGISETERRTTRLP